MIFRKYHLDKLIMFLTVECTGLLIYKSLKFSQSFKQCFTFTILILSCFNCFALGLFSSFMEQQSMQCFPRKDHSLLIGKRNQFSCGIWCVLRAKDAFKGWLDYFSVLTLFPLGCTCVLPRFFHYEWQPERKLFCVQIKTCLLLGVMCCKCVGNEMSWSSPHCSAG